MFSYHVTLDVSRKLVQYVSGLLYEERRERGTRRGTRVLTCFRQALFILAWFRDRPDIARLGRGFGLSQATAYRYLDEGIIVLSRQAPDLYEALDRAVAQEVLYLILDGTLIDSDRVAGTVFNRKGEEIDAWYSGKNHGFAGLLQGLMNPDGVPLWMSDVLPGHVHDLPAARELVLEALHWYLRDLPVLADSGYQGAGQGILTPVKKPKNGDDLDINAKTYNKLQRGLRARGERGFALLKQRWKTLRHVTMSPTKIGRIAQAALVLTQYEHKMIT